MILSTSGISNPREAKSVLIRIETEPFEKR